MSIHATPRTAAIILVSLLAVHISLVVFNNLLDYDSNFRFVQAVLSMEDVFSTSQTWRAFTSPWMHHLAYWLIIATEFSITLMLWIGAVAMFRKRNSTTRDFSDGSRWALRGLLLGMVLWFGFFIAAGGEWFLMWQSEKWNAQPTAFYLFLSYLAVLIVQLLPENENR